MDRHGRTTVVPLSRRISRRISNTLNVESTCETGRPVSEMIRSIVVASPPITESTCCSNSFSSSFRRMVNHLVTSQNCGNNAIFLGTVAVSVASGRGVALVVCLPQVGRNVLRILVSVVSSGWCRCLYAA